MADRHTHLHAVLLLAALATAAACHPSGSDPGGGGALATGSDAGISTGDAGSQVGQDAGPRVGQDAGPPPVDAGGGLPDSGGIHYADASAAPDAASWGTYDAGSYWGDASSAAMADACSQPIEEQGVDAGVDAGEGDAAWAWFQLSPDDSTSMASAQILKQEGAYYGFPLKPHEVHNYYDPPAALRSAGALPREWETAEGIYIGIDAEQVEPTAGAPGNATPLYDPDGGPLDVGVQEVPAGADLELLVHVFAPAVPLAERKRWTLHLCVDVSGSMAGDKIAFVRNALQLLVDALQPGDRISLTTFETEAHVIFPTLDFASEESRIRDAIAALQDQGSTNMIDGLYQAYAEAQAAYDPATVNRVLLFSDGNANVGDTDVRAFANLTRINNQEGIYLSGVGVGYDYATERMDALTDAGKGAHVFLPDGDEVGVIFGRMVRKLVEVAADEVSVEVMLPSSFAIERFSGEEVSTNPNARVPNVVLAAGDDMTLLASFHSDDLSAFDQDMVLTVRYRPLSTADQVVLEQRFPIAALLGPASALMQRSRLVDGYARWACEGDPQVDPDALLGQVQAFSPSDPGLVEIAQQIERLR